MNLFIDGDNLDGLFYLRKDYLNKIKMIYIDPPYNTGIKRQYRDKFTHDEWKSMMYPRLCLARDLLRDDGVIFINIDDHEQHRLRVICDEIFGEGNFINNIIWQKKNAPQNCTHFFSNNHDFILCYAKNKKIWRPNFPPRTEKQDSAYKNPDNDPRGLWKISSLTAPRLREKCIYPIELPSGKTVYPPRSRSWRVSRERFNELLKDNRIWFGAKGDGVPHVKRFLTEVKQGVTPLTVWLYDEVGSTNLAKKEILKLFENNFDHDIFNTPKPTKLIQHMLLIGSNNDDIILDFFAGSCTTAHAVMKLNAGDGGNRKFIMVENSPEIAALGKERIHLAAKSLEVNCDMEVVKL